MENLVLKTVRFNAEALRKIKQVHEKEPYWKQTSIINQLLTTLLKCADSDTIHRMLNTNFPWEKGYVITFKVNADTIEKRNKPTYDD